MQTVLVYFDKKLTRCFTTKGIVTIGEGLTQSYAGLVVCRVLLGALEAGYFPGAIYLLSMYYTRYELHTRMNIYYSAGIISSAFGGVSKNFLWNL